MDIRQVEILHEKGCHILEQTPQRGGRATIPGSAQETAGHGN